MEMFKLLKILPMMIMVGVLSYAAYTINTLTVVPAPKNAAAKADAPGDIADSGNDEDAAPRAKGSFRDPFVRLIKVDPVEKAAKDGQKNAVDSYREIVKNLDLSATFIQGKAQYAVIDGRLYKVGDHLHGQGEVGALVLSKVAFHDVTLAAGGRQYSLGYPASFMPTHKAQAQQAADAAGGDAAILGQDPNLALIRTLLSSPLGSMGRTMVGAQGLQLPMLPPNGTMPERPAAR